MTSARRHQAVLSSNRPAGRDVFLMSIRDPGLAKRVRPGQFVMLRHPERLDPLLPRPFSVHDSEGADLKLLYRLAGRGTRYLSQLKPGMMVDVIGPLGRGFTPGRGGQAVLVAGGLGIAPMPLLAKKLRSLKVPSALFYGCRDKGQLLAPPGIKAVISTDDGSCGRRGQVTDLLEDRLRHGGTCRVYACGPWAMLRRVSLVCRDNRTPCQVSLEARMACGVGACQGCAVKAAGGGYLHVCSDGPVFDSRRIDWEQEPPV